MSRTTGGSSLILAPEPYRAVHTIRCIDGTSRSRHGGDALLHSGHSAAAARRGRGRLALDHRGGLVDCRRMTEFLSGCEREGGGVGKR